MATRTIRNKAQRLMFSRFFLNPPPALERTVLLAGVARSGSTWLSNLINYRNDYRYMFEPFHGETSPIAPFLKGRPYRRPGDGDPDLEALAQRVFSGRVRDRWVDKLNGAPLGRRRLVKEVAGNLFLGWLHRRFPQVPMVVLFRHPLAVVHSRRKLGWEHHLSAIVEQAGLLEDHFAGHEDFLRGSHSEFAAPVLQWCVETLVPLRQLAGAEVHACCYERLVANPDGELPPLFRFLGMEYHAGVLRHVGVPSSTSRAGSAVREGGNVLLEQWQGAFTEAEQHEALALLRRFGLDRLYTLDPMPAEGVLAGHRIEQGW